MSNRACAASASKLGSARVLIGPLRIVPHRLRAVIPRISTVSAAKAVGLRRSGGEAVPDRFLKTPQEGTEVIRVRGRGDVLRGFRAQRTGDNGRLRLGVGPTGGCLLALSVTC